MNDRTFRPIALSNPFRRWFAPPRRDIDRLSPQPGDRVTDLGAGVGYYAEEVLARIGASGHLTLVDINGPNLARFARRHGPDPRLGVLVGSAAAVPQIPSESQHRVLLANVLCDVVDKTGVLDETWRILRPGGTVFASFHWDDSPSPSRPLRMTAEKWTALKARHSWEEVGQGHGRGIHWHILRKAS